MIDEIYQAGTDQALNDQVQRPKPFQPTAKPFSLTEFAWQGIARPTAAGFVARPIAFGADLAGAFGDVLGAGGFNQGGMFSTPTDEERKQQEAARRKLLDSGPSFSSEGGDIFRERAKQLMPDPQSTHAATQVAAGVSEFMGNAVLYAATTGPAAPFLVAGDAALSEADKLKQQGVSLGARTAAGAVAGLSAGVAVALPVVGKTIAQTAGLVVAGGPGGFIAQNAAERAILANAGYDKIASQYDPLDPVGLALSTLVPAGFGAVAFRARTRAASAPTLKEVVLANESGGQRYDKSGNILTSPKGAKGEMQVMDRTNLDPGFGVRPAADSSPAERARVGSDYLDAMLARYGSEDKAMAAYNAGPGALDAAIAKGGDWLSHLPAETQAYVAKGMKRLGEGRTDAAARASIARDPDAVAAARVNQTAKAIDSYRLTPDSDLAGMTRHQDAMETAHEQLARGESVSVSDIVRNSDSARANDFAARVREVFLPDTRSIIEGQGGVRFYETRGGSERFHGTAKAIGQLSDEYALAGDSRNIYGQGFYTTDAADISAGYMKKGKGGGVLYRVEHTDAKLYDMERPLTADVQAILRETMGDYLPVENAETGKLLTNLREVYDEYRSESANNGMSRDEVQEAFDSIRYRLEEQGFRGFEHAGGKKTGSAEHKVKIFWQPEQDVQISKADIGDYRPRAVKVAEPVDAAPPPRAASPDAAVTANTDAGAATSEAKASAALDSQAAEIADLHPDLMVQLEGMDKPMRVSELLETVKREADEEVQGASLIDVAANCFLRSA